MVCMTCSLFKDEEPDPCGPEVKFDLVFNNVSSEPWNHATWNVYTEGNNRIYQVGTPLIDNVCPDKHILLEFTSYFKPGSARVLHERVLIRYSIFEGTRIGDKIIDDSNDTYALTEGTNFGIKNAYSSIPGSFWLYFEWVLDNWQNDDVDLAYFKEHFVAGTLEAKYYQFAK